MKTSVLLCAALLCVCTGRTFTSSPTGPPFAKAALLSATAPSKPSSATPLTLACTAGDWNEAMRLIKAGADINARDEHGCTALYYASGSSNEEMIDVVKALVERGADVNARRDDGFTPLHQACFSGTYAAVQFLISKGADVNAREQSSDTPLHVIAGCSMLHRHPELGEPELIALALLEHGAKLDARDKDGLTPLQVAAKADPRDPAMLKFLRDLEGSAPATQPAK